MQVTLDAKAEKLVRERLKGGQYGSAEEVLLAALEALDREPELGDFQPGELDHLVAEGENSGEPIEWDQVLGELASWAIRQAPTGPGREPAHRLAASVTCSTRSENTSSRTGSIVST